MENEMEKISDVKKKIREQYKERGITPATMKRMVYKTLVDSDPEFVEKRLKERREEFFKATLRELPEKEAREFTDLVFWWID